KRKVTVPVGRAFMPTGAVVIACPVGRRQGRPMMPGNGAFAKLGQRRARLRQRKRASYRRIGPLPIAGPLRLADSFAVVIVPEKTMNRRILQAFLGACLALAVGGLAAQTPATGGDTSAKSDAQATPSAQSQTSAQQPSSTSKQAKAKKSSHHTKT